MESKLIVLLFLVGSLNLFGQALNFEKEQKVLTNYKELFYKKAPTNYQKAIDKTRKYIEKRKPVSVNAYETLVEMEYIKYYYYKSLFKNDIGITYDASGKKNLNVMQRYYFYNLINTCRVSTLESTSYTADMLLRTILLDENPDTLITDSAKAFFKTAEDFFDKEAYEQAGLNYRFALEEDPHFYQASLYLGDSFWARKELDSAIVYFDKTKNNFPKLIEPRLFLINALVDNGLYYRAKKECLEAIAIYPGQDIKLKLQEILRLENKYMNEHRFKRDFFPNDKVASNQNPLTDKSIWADYRGAKKDVELLCNDDGIIKVNDRIADRYLEVYSYRKMLEENQSNLPEHLAFADKMRVEGFLEPYVLISLYHIDIYPQLNHYVSQAKNRAKTIEFIEKYLIETLPALP